MKNKLRNLLKKNVIWAFKKYEDTVEIKKQEKEVLKISLLNTHYV